MKVSLISAGSEGEKGARYDVPNPLMLTRYATSATHDMTRP